MKPIIFNAAMVRAVLDGRKTQTRRVAKLHSGRLGDEYMTETANGLVETVELCPYGIAGDKLWVRETFWIQHDNDCDDYRIFDCGINIAEDDWAGVRYCATDKEPAADWQFYSKRPSIHMPRWASRITLEITSIRVEQLQSISGEDCVAEGVDCLYEPDTNVPADHYNRQSFASLWDSINAKRGYSWQFNPWVWVLEFKRVK